MLWWIARRSPLAALLSGVLLAPLTLQAEETSSVRHQLSLGSYYSRGDYGESSNTEVYFVPLGYEYHGDGWRLRASAPWLRISGPGSVLVNIGGVTRPDAPAEDEEALLQQRTASEGLGDVILGLSWELPAWSQSAPFIDFGLELKLPSADAEARLGTGAADLAVQVDFYWQLGEGALFSTLGYRFRGPSDWYEALQDGGFVSLGFARNLAQQQWPGEFSWGVIHDYRQAASGLSRPTHELLPYLSWQPQPQWTMMSYLVRGFGRDTPDYAIGLQLTRRW